MVEVVYYGTLQQKTSVLEIILALQIIMEEKLSQSQLLDNAIDYIYSLVQYDDWICEKLLDIPEEEKICSEGCENMNKECVLRFLKHYKNGKNT